MRLWASVRYRQCPHHPLRATQGRRVPGLTAGLPAVHRPRHGGGVRGRDAEIAGPDRDGQVYRHCRSNAPQNDRPCYAVCDQYGFVFQQFRVERARRIVDFAGQFLDQLAILVENARGEHIIAVFNLQAAPGADPDLAIRAFLGSIKREPLTGFRRL